MKFGITLDAIIFITVSTSNSGCNVTNQGIKFNKFSRLIHQHYSPRRPSVLHSGGSERKMPVQIEIIARNLSFETLTTLNNVGDVQHL